MMIRFIIYGIIVFCYSLQLCLVILYLLLQVLLLRTHTAHILMTAFQVIISALLTHAIQLDLMPYGLRRLRIALLRVPGKTGRQLPQSFIFLLGQVLRTQSCLRLHQVRALLCIGADLLLADRVLFEKRMQGVPPCFLLLTHRMLTQASRSPGQFSRQFILVCDLLDLRNLSRKPCPQFLLFFSSCIEFL